MVDEEIGMPAKRELSMRQLRQLLRLHHDGVSAREIGRRLGVARSTIQDNLKRAAAAGLAWPLAEGVTDDALERQLFGRAGVTQGQRRRVEPDWAALARELKRPGVTMMILWEEYREAYPEGYGYSRFCDLLRGFERRLTPVMRQHHVAGEKAFVDYSGKRIGIVDPSTGEIREAEIFVGVLGASNLTYAEATWTQKAPDWTGAHVRMFRFFGGAPKLLVPDNLKSGVNKASFYDPEINRTYGSMAALRRRNSSGASVSAEGQGESRGRSQICPDLHSGAAASADLLLARRMQRGDRARHATHERASHAQPRPEPARAVRERRARRPRRVARRRLGVRGMAAGARQPRLSHRGPRLPLLGSPRPDPRRSRRSRHRPHGRDLPSRPARRRSSATLHGPQARNGLRAHAQFPPALRRVDAGTVPSLGRQDRAEHRRLDQRCARQPPASRTGLPNLPGHSALLSRPRSRTPRGGLRPRRRAGRPQLQRRRRAPRPQTRRS